MGPWIAAIVLFTVMTVFAIAIGIISNRDEHEREKKAGSM